MSGYVSVELQRLVRSRFADCCAYCKTAEALTATTFEIEHIVPKTAGGDTIIENLCLACPFCNRHKATRQTVIDPVTQKEVLLFHPYQQVWTEHFAWNDSATEIIGLTPSGRATIATLQMNRSPLVRVRRMWVQMGEHPPN